jgi:mono/diheme cytochrome c family protein
MRHVLVRRTALLLGATLLGCAGLFSWVVNRQAVPQPPPASAVPGAAPFQSHCVSCHTAENLRLTLLGSPDRRPEIERFLVAHGDASDSDDRLILDYLGADSAPMHQR